MLNGWEETTEYMVNNKSLNTCIPVRNLKRIKYNNYFVGILIVIVFVTIRYSAQENIVLIS